jgi:hypothetical protein
MTATDERPVTGRSLRVKGVSHFGSHKRGKVLPQWVAELSGSTAEELVADGTLEWTDELPTGDFRAPTPKEGIDPAPAMTEELDRLRRRVVVLESDQKNLVAQDAALRSQVDKQTRSLGEITSELSHWKRTAEEYRLQVVELTDELEKATTPAVPGGAIAPPKPPAKTK